MFLRTKGAVQARTNHSVVAPVVASVLALPMYHLITHHLLAVDFHQEGTKVTDMLLGQGQDMIGIVNPHPDLVTNLDLRRPGLATVRESVTLTDHQGLTVNYRRGLAVAVNVAIVASPLLDLGIVTLLGLIATIGIEIIGIIGIVIIGRPINVGRKHKLFL